MLWNDKHNVIEKTEEDRRRQKKTGNDRRRHKMVEEDIFRKEGDKRGQKKVD